ncbi:7-cyano-7-deazaguanine synthase [subsurface metagenome]
MNSIEKTNNQGGFSIVLLSGGIDSAACVHYYSSQSFRTRGFFVDYGQPPAQREKLSAAQISFYYNIKLDVFQLTPCKFSNGGEIKGRNGLFIFAALLYYPRYSGLIASGIHSGTPYYDCSEVFIRDISKILNGYTNGQVVLDMPFLKWNKQMIYEYCKQNNVPIYMTYSCETNNDKPCGKCLSCLDRKTLNAG